MDVVVHCNLNKIIKVLGDDKITACLFRGAEIIRDGIKARAPQGPRGNLKRSIVARKMPISRIPVAIVAVDRKIAPHAHWKEFGGKRERVPKRRQVLADKSGKIWGKRVAPIPAHPFFRPGWDATKGQAENIIKKTICESIERAVR